jgi:two-component system sensor histidine kinase YesM
MMGFGQVEKAQRMTVAFMRLIRKIFENKQEWITVRQEIEHIQDYIAIMQLRYDSSFEMNFKLQEEALDGKMIKLILQPLVENAIFHGLEPKRGGGTIRIEVEREVRDLVLTVSDDGVGMTEEQLENIWSPHRRSSPNGFNNIGIVNIQERVRLHFGNKYGLSIASRFGEGTRVAVRMPYMEEGELPDVDRIDRG